MSSRKVSRLFFVALPLWFLFVAIVCLRVYLHPGSHSVFTTYRAAGGAWIHQAEIYGRTAGTFLYSPLIAALYSPFALISQKLSEVIWRLLLGLALPLALWFNARKLFDFSEREFFCLFFLILPLTLSSLNDGQANIIIIVLFLVSAGAAMQSRCWTCAFCASFAIYWKIYPIAFALLLVVIFPKELTIRMVLALIGLFVASLLLQKPSYVLQEYASWLASLASDRRRTLEYYGRWRDFYLLLRLIGIPISTLWWNIVQATAAITGALICLVGAIRRWPVVTLVFGAMSLAIVWMLLFGPATEAATYVLIAVPSAYLVMFGWFDAYHPLLRITSIVTYLGFVGADILNSWFHIKKNVYLIHAIQPCFTLCFCAALFLWWRQELFNGREHPGVASQRSDARR
jgi:hypothetical protein